MIIKRFDASMLHECIQLYQDVFSKDPWFETSDDRDVERYFMTLLENNKCLGYVYIEDEAIVAFSVGFLKAWIKGEEYYIDQFAVATHRQGKGIGSIFLEEIKKDLLDHDIHAMILATEHQFPSFRFYLNNGFQHLEDLRFLGVEF